MEVSRVGSGMSIPDLAGATTTMDHDLNFLRAAACIARSDTPALGGLEA
jgi:hypothetical protein